MNYEILNRILEPIFENSELWEVDLVFSPTIELSQEEFKEIVAHADPLQEVRNGDLILDEYEWWEYGNQYLKLRAEYYREDDKIILKELYFWREIRE